MVIYKLYKGDKILELISYLIAGLPELLNCNMLKICHFLSIKKSLQTEKHVLICVYKIYSLYIHSLNVRKILKSNLIFSEKLISKDFTEKNNTKVGEAYACIRYIQLNMLVLSV